MLRLTPLARLPLLSIWNLRFHHPLGVPFPRDATNLTWCETHPEPSSLSNANGGGPEEGFLVPPMSWFSHSLRICCLQEALRSSMLVKFYPDLPSFSHSRFATLVCNWEKLSPSWSPSSVKNQTWGSFPVSQWSSPCPPQAWEDLLVFPTHPSSPIRQLWLPQSSSSVQLDAGHSLWCMAHGWGCSSSSQQSWVTRSIALKPVSEQHSRRPHGHSHHLM